MTTLMLPTGDLSIAPSMSGRSVSGAGLTIGVFRLPADPLFYADITLQNVVVGSRYRITRADNGLELATGLAASTTTVISGVPCYANPMLVYITVRRASGSPNYRIFDTAANVSRSGTTAYILQQLDE